MSRAQRGLALVAVMWMVAALAILAAGLASLTRGEIRVAQGARLAAEVAALGDAGIQLAMLDMRSDPGNPPGLLRKAYDFDGRPVEVTIVPAAGLVDLNTAGEPLLRDLFVFGAGMDESFAEDLALRIVEWRTPGRELEDPDYVAAGTDFRPRGGEFEYPEDLLQVLGVSYDDYAKIERLISVSGGASGIDPMSAPDEVLGLLASGDGELVARISGARANLDPAVDLTGLTQAHLGGGGSGVHRLDAVVAVDGKHYRRTRWIDISIPAHDGAPWRTVRIEAVVGIHTGADFDNGV